MPQPVLVGTLASGNGEKNIKLHRCTCLALLANGNLARHNAPGLCVHLRYCVFEKHAWLSINGSCWYTFKGPTRKGVPVNCKQAKDHVAEPGLSTGAGEFLGAIGSFE